MAESDEGYQLTPEEAEKYAKVAEVLTPGSMEIVRLYGEEDTRRLLNEWGDVFCDGMLAAIMAEGVQEESTP